MPVPSYKAHSIYVVFVQFAVRWANAQRLCLVFLQMQSQVSAARAQGVSFNAVVFSLKDGTVFSVDTPSVALLSRCAAELPTGHRQQFLRELNEATQEQVERAEALARKRNIEQSAVRAVSEAERAKENAAVAKLEAIRTQLDAERRAQVAQLDAEFAAKLAVSVAATEVGSDAEAPATIGSSLANVGAVVAGAVADAAGGVAKRLMSPRGGRANRN